MKETLRRLLQAEEAGREAASALNARGEVLLHEAQSKSEDFVRDARSATEKQVEALKRQAEDEADLGRKMIQVETDAAIEHLRREAVQRRPQAVKQVIALLLDET